MFNLSNIKTKYIPSFDPFDVKQELVGLAEDYFQVGNLDVYESGFLGYLIQSLTFLTSDTLYQNAMAYNEAFLNRAILPSSVTEIASQLDYSIVKTVPASGFLTLIIPIPNNEDLLVKISAGSSVYADNIPYKVKHNYYIEKNSSGIYITAQNLETGLVENIPYDIELRAGVLSLVFSVEIWQIDIYYHEFTFENPTLYVFYEEVVSGYEGQIHEIKINVDGELYKELVSIYQAKPDDRCYELKINTVTNTLSIKFGNGVYGYLPKTGASSLVTIHTTLGSNGNIVANSAVLAERIVDNISGKQIVVESYNPLAITNGQDSESIEDIKRHTRENISAAKRLVSENDYRGFQGITGLTNVQAIPVLNRRDIVGNNITLFTVMYDNTNKPIPAASIPAELNLDRPVIAQGEEIEYNDVIYKSPFRVELDDEYDIPRAKYTYSLNLLSIAPSLFSKGSIEDILMGLRQIQAKIQETNNQISFICDIYKLPEMDGSKISGILKIVGLDDINLTHVKVYEDKVTVNISSDIIDSLSIPTGRFLWTLELYYDNEQYNTYKGEWELYKFGIPAGDNIYAVGTGIYPNSFLNFVSLNFKVLSNTDKGYFTIPIEKVNDIDPFGNDVEPERIKVYINISNNTYEAILNGVAQNTYTYITPYINLSEIDTDSISWSMEIVYNGVTWNTYNVYNGNITILAQGRRPVDTVVNSQPGIIGEPLIPLIHLGLNNIIVTTDMNGDYVFVASVSKMPKNNAQYIECKLIIEHELINMSETMIFDGETQEDVNQETNANNTPSSSVTFISPSIAPDLLPLGAISFKIELSYDGEVYSVYKQSAVFHHDMTQICFSNVSQGENSALFAWNIPVIEKTYYDQNILYLDQYVFNVLARLRDMFYIYKMLTDRVNIKFAKTYGKSINMRLNKYNPVSVKTYPDDYSTNITPDIRVKIYVPKRAQSSIPTIVEECKNVLYTFLQLKANYHTNVYKSEISRFLHDAVEDIEFCEVLEPAEDIIYDFNLETIPRNERIELYKYCPEFIWFDKDKINIDVTLMS